MDKFLESISSGLKHSALAGAVLYFLGWVYLFFYFKQFDVDLSQLDLSWNDVLVHSAAFSRHLFSDALHWPGALWAFVIIPLVIWLSDRHGALLLEKFGFLGKGLLNYYLPTVLAFILIAALLLLAARSGKIAATATRISTNDSQTIAFKQNCEVEKMEIISSVNANGKMKLLRATPKWYFFFAQTGDWHAGNTRITDIHVIQVPSDCILSITGAVREKR